MYPFRSTYLPNFQCLLQFTPVFYHLINNQVLYLPNSASLAPRFSSSWSIQLVHEFISSIHLSCTTQWSWKSCRNVPSQCRLCRGNLQNSLLHTQLTRDMGQWQSPAPLPGWGCKFWAFLLRLPLVSAAGRFQFSWFERKPSTWKQEQTELIKKHRLKAVLQFWWKGGTWEQQ